jgi:hypothetical protein
MLLKGAGRPHPQVGRCCPTLNRKGQSYLNYKSELLLAGIFVRDI